LRGSVAFADILAMTAQLAHRAPVGLASYADAMGLKRAGMPEGETWGADRLAETANKATAPNAPHKTTAPAILASEFASAGVLHASLERDVRRHVVCTGFEVVISPSISSEISIRAPYGVPTVETTARVAAAIAELVGEPVKVGVWCPSRSRAFAHARRLSDPKAAQLGEEHERAPQPPAGPRKGRR
jgi:hypothetical protein